MPQPSSRPSAGCGGGKPCQALRHTPTSSTLAIWGQKMCIFRCCLLGRGHRQEEKDVSHSPQLARSLALSAGGPGVSRLEQTAQLLGLGFEPPPSQQKLLKRDTHAPREPALGWDTGPSESPNSSQSRPPTPPPALPFPPAVSSTDAPPHTYMCVFNSPVSLICQHTAPGGQAGGWGRYLSPCHPLSPPLPLSHSAPP